MDCGIERCLASFLKIFVIHMEFMEHSMQKGRKNHPHHGDKDQPAKKRVGRREHFAAHTSQRIDRAHASQDHRRVQERIDPGKTGDPMIPGNAKA